jgi:hypothetical protein
MFLIKHFIIVERVRTLQVFKKLMTFTYENFNLFKWIDVPCV